MSRETTDSGNKKPALLIRRGGSLGAIAFACAELRVVIVAFSLGQIALLVVRF